ncbi:MAG TPA: sensor histidine kinase KdpD [Acidimicrobiales bacterium]|nr:sensor histidine kinase KdpD [Acidimicrobiales bacterium]
MARGILRIYLGAAPGVGKTFAMLDEGWRGWQRGTDVVVGYVETHGRPKTEAQIRDLEVVPRRRLEYRGQTFEEMDIDAVLARRPEIVLVDELAHTNVPGSRNEKRWQDVEELLDAGIKVITTVNIQHLESLNDVVETITGITQRETVPDAVVRAADQIELVDMSPEALRRRMAHGNIYIADKVDTALANYFRVGNLAALRELALLWVADRVDESLQDYRERHGIAERWETKERVVVAITGAPSTDDLIRRAARVASRTHAELIGVHIQSTDGLSTAGAGLIEAHRVLLGELGGTYHEVVGDDVATALVQVARAENATQIVLGSSRRSRWTELTRGSVINRVIREAGGAIDVHVISPHPDEAGEHMELRSPPRFRLAALPRRRRVAGFVITVIGLPLLTFVLSHLRGSFGQLQNALLCYLLLVVAVATIGGVWPAAVASVVGFLLLNWFFAPPIHTFTIANNRDFLALIVFLVVAGVIAWLVNEAAKRTADAYRARGEAQALSRLAGIVLREPEPLPALVEDLVATFRMDGAAVLAADPAGGWRAEVAVGAAPSTPEEATLALPLTSRATLAVRGQGLQAQDREILVAFGTQLAVALEAHRLQAEAATAEALAKANELRTALLAAVSHDLRTPLASIKAAATSLLGVDVTFDRETTTDLLQTIDLEADRLNLLVGNLLDMSRLQTGSLVVSARPVGVDEVVAGAIASVQGAESVRVDVPESIPEVLVDPALLERAVANLIENALRYAPRDTPVRVEAGRVDGRVDLRVIDAGTGVPTADRERVFRAFQRLGDNPNGSGVGLGLAVARGFVEAMGGNVVMDDTPGGGCTVVVSMPVAQPT